ncbi:bifunctional [glutamine synthetase] adenylyltransferase/[glutamine synthetase]-adenylyl-L-tyrosine phosphorylase [Marivibrio halodurans]|uniref:Bifunctional glutamine synthetase adenylyltransferase/adenylyl-removing enzyme n=1 Tax=Marivibrio halodurans TaxID=2039722 RepID=A0A8J7SLM3_9PROT|nr:bifunctional [glutamine synthetase] adenylyltransferase/[glutamine synthetase]-adenylyl-L-tyrosine phosphorylase [Marivibrio halodurans]MBP5856953.1 bifunctional [glutamine synthetase] adenylyltransferase/[glutamine synthetase]-adenylyl-L-tyrosine phosphorylase [Marivibrio halodurans]
MSETPFPIDPDAIPRPSDPSMGAAALDRLLEALRGASAGDRGTDKPTASGERIAARLDAARDGPLGTLFGGMLAASPYLAQLAAREGETLARVLDDGPDAALAEALSSARSLIATPDGFRDLKTVMRTLRTAKRHVALISAIADCAGAWPLERVTEALSDMADAALDAAIAHVVGDLTGTGAGKAATGDGCGVVVLGMGKLGARELNYSSDIDIMIFYDPDRLTATGVDPDRLRQDMTRAARTVMRVMDERTADGYVFRTDMRLRPDPSVTPLAITVRAAETYYESLGQNWERAAMIKARPVAGDKALGREFLAHIRPFVWRKHLDFAAIDDIQSIKRQINAYRGGGRIAIEGHDVKIGRGGIREIEFFVQTQQLIWGGRDPELRPRRTLDGLAALADAGHVAPDTAREMAACYRFLRTLEHRLQMTNDEQTQKLPEQTEKLATLAGFMGFDGVGAFRTAVRRTFETVEGHYARLFEEAPELGGDGALSFTGTDDDPDTLKTLSDMGYREPARVAGRIRIWHHGRYRASRSERARQILTELTPRLLKALADTADPDEAFKRFDNFLEGLPAGVQLFSLFHANPQLLDLVAEIMGTAPRLAEWLARKPILLDAVLTPEFLYGLEDHDALREDLHETLAQARDFEDVLVITRRWANDQKFKNGVQLLRGLAEPKTAARHLSDMAEAALAEILAAVEGEFAETHGRFPGGGLAIVAFGKLGGRELMPRSDLDLVFVYDHAPEVSVSDGGKPLGPAVYYLRLCQRLVTAIASETGEGKLFEVDNRLRPDGKSGPLATQFETFRSYYRGTEDKPVGDAWTWEHMALTRARAVAGPAALRERIDATIAANLNQPRDPVTLADDIVRMRARIAREFPGTSPWGVKYRPGGLVDVEFVTQFLQLSSGGGPRPVFSPNTGLALDRLCEAGHLSEPAHADLRAGLDLWRRLQIGLRLTATEGGFDAASAPEGQRRLLMRMADATDFEDLETRMADAARAVSARFVEYLGTAPHAS